MSNEQTKQQSQENNQPEVFELKDPVTNEVHKIPKSLEGVVKNLMDFNKRLGKQTADEKYKPVMQEVEKFKSENEKIKKALDDFEKANMSEKEKIQFDYERKLQDIEGQYVKQKEQAESYRKKFEQNKISSDIMGALSGYDLYNIRQTATVFMNMSKVELIEGDGDITTMVTISLPDDSGKVKEYKLTPADAVKRWIGLEENLFHLKNKLTPGGGSKESNGKIKTNSRREQYEEAIKKGNFAAAIQLTSVKES